VKQGSGLELTDPKIINDAGDIVLEGLLSNGDAHSVVLIPCDADEEGYMDSAEAARLATPRASAPTLNRAGVVASPQQRLTPRSGFAAWRAQMLRRYIIPGLGAPKN
jgi:hypothetical protein